MIASFKEERQSGADLRLTARGEHVRAVLQLTDLDQLLKIRENAETALDSAE